MLPLAAGLALGCLFAWLAIRGVELSEVRQILSTRLAILPALAALLCYLLYFLLKTLRWRLILAPMRVLGMRDLFPYVMVGYLGNLALPLQLGEAYRGYSLSRDYPVRAVAVLSGIFLEKLFDLAVVTGLAFVAIELAHIDSPAFESVQQGLLWLSFAGLALSLVVLIKPATAASLGRRLIGLLPAGRLFDGLRRLLRHAVKGLAVLADGTQAARVLFVSLLSWLLMLATVYLSLLAVGATGSPGMSAVILLFTVLGLTLPTSPGFVGTIQIAFVAGARLFDGTQEQALAASIFYNLLITLPPTLIAVICISVLHRRRSAPRD